MKDGAFISDFSSEPFFKIQSVQKLDKGEYRCYARNTAGTIVSEKIPLTVAYMTDFDDDDAGVLRVELGHAAVFDFPKSLESEPNPSVSWQTDDGITLYGSKYAVTNDNRLVVLNVDFDDQKLYRFVAAKVKAHYIRSLLERFFRGFLRKDKSIKIRKCRNAFDGFLFFLLTSASGFEVHPVLMMKDFWS